MMARSVAALSAFFRGELDEARKQAAIGERHLLPNFAQPLAGIAITRANLALIDGDLDEAEAQARRCLAATEQLGDTDLMVLSHRILAEIDLRRGEIDRALDHFATSVETLFGRTDRPDDAAFLGSSLAAIALRVDELDLAMTAAESIGFDTPSAWAAVARLFTANAHANPRTLSWLAFLDVALVGVGWLWIYSRLGLRSWDAGGVGAFLAGRAGRQMRNLLKTEIERDEIERRSDPRDPHDHVQPAQAEGHPLPDHRVLDDRSHHRPP